MSVILVADEDANDARRIVDALRGAGWDAEIVRDPARVARRGSEEAPHRLLLASTAHPEAAALLDVFSRRRGGPGSIALVPAALKPSGGVEDRADEILAKPFSDADLRRVVRSLATASETRQLTSADIFGDILAEVDAEARRGKGIRRRKLEPKRAVDDVERKLEETLSGILPEKLRRKETAEATELRPSAAAVPRPRGRLEQASTAEIDRLLDQTLSSLALPKRTGKAPSVSAPRASGEEPEPGASARPPEKPTPIESPDLRAPRDGDLPSDHPADEGSDPSPAEGIVFVPPPEFELPAFTARSGDEGPPQPVASFSPAVSENASPARSGDDFGDYAMLDRIAIGGMAEVWRARRRGVEGFQKTVAIKKILAHLTDSPEFVSMLIDEAKLAAQLNHNNIIQIYDLGKVGEDFFIAMEYVEGKNLRSILNAARERQEPIPLGLALLIASALARALDYAHRKRDFEDREMGLVHRDVSPQNVLISHEGEIKLCDFGIAKAVSKAVTTQMGALKGKLQYMSPEQAWGRHVDPRSDIFSLGAVLFEVLTGVRLFAADSELEVLDAVREGRVRSPCELDPEIPEAVERIVLRALARRPEERYQTAGEMEQDLEAALAALKLTPGPKELAAYLDGLFEASESPAADRPARKATSAGSAAAGIAPAAAPNAEAAASEGTAPTPGEPGVARATRSRRVLIAAAAAAMAVIAAGAGYVALQRQGDDVGPPAEEVPRAPTPSVATGAEAAPADAEAAELPANLEQLVAEEVSRRREEIVEEFEAKKRRLEEELEKARQLESASAPEDSAQGSTERVPSENGDQGNSR